MSRNKTKAGAANPQFVVRKVAGLPGLPGLDEHVRLQRGTVVRPEEGRLQNGQGTLLRRGENLSKKYM